MTTTSAHGAHNVLLRAGIGFSNLRPSTNTRELRPIRRLPAIRVVHHTQKEWLDESTA